MSFPRYGNNNIVNNYFNPLDYFNCMYNDIENSFQKVSTNGLYFHKFLFQIFLCRILLLCYKQEWNWNTHVQICNQNQSQIHVPILYLCLYTPFYNAVFSTFTYYLWMLLMNILHIKKNEKDSNLAQKNTLPFCFMGFCLQRSQQVYLPVWNYLFIKQQNNEQTIFMSHHHHHHQ